MYYKKYKIDFYRINTIRSYFIIFFSPIVQHFEIPRRGCVHVHNNISYASSPLVSIQMYICRLFVSVCGPSTHTRARARRIVSAFIRIETSTHGRQDARQELWSIQANCALTRVGIINHSCPSTRSLMTTVFALVHRSYGRRANVSRGRRHR